MHDFFIGFGFWWETGGGGWGDLHAHIVWLISYCLILVLPKSLEGLFVAREW